MQPANSFTNISFFFSLLKTQGSLTDSLLEYPSECALLNRYSKHLFCLYCHLIGNEGAVDFRTLGNQIAARMLEEVRKFKMLVYFSNDSSLAFLKMFNISGLDVMNPRTYKDQQGGWKYVTYITMVTDTTVTLNVFQLDFKVLRKMLLS